MNFADAQLAGAFLRGAKEIVRVSAATYRGLHPDAGETFLDLGETYAAFTGNGSPLTQASGVFSNDDLAAIRAFYRDRADEWEAVLTPYGDATALNRLIAVGGEARFWENLLFRASGLLPVLNLPPEAEIIEVSTLEEIEVWSRVGFDGQLAEEPNDLGKLMGGSLARPNEGRSKSRGYLALWNGEPVASARATIVDRVVWLSGAATLIPYRKQGLQNALIIRRLADAASETDMAFIGSEPGSGSQRNAERLGFRVAFSELSVFIPT